MSLPVHAAGFDTPVLRAQTVFRGALDAMARPGSVVALPADALSHLGALPCHPATAALLLTLADPDTPVHLGLDEAANAALVEWLAFHCGAPVVSSPEQAAFAVIPLRDLDTERLFAYAPGEPDYPDRATTVICEADGIEAVAGGGDVPTLTGPGVRETSALALQPEPARFWQAMHRNRARYPLGPDVFLTSGDRIAGVPRSTRIHAPEATMAKAS